jgi:hypothetical protein
MLPPILNIVFIQEALVVSGVKVRNMHLARIIVQADATGAAHAIAFPAAAKAM